MRLHTAYALGWLVVVCCSSPPALSQDDFSDFEVDEYGELVSELDLYIDQGDFRRILDTIGRMRNKDLGTGISELDFMEGLAHQELGNTSAAVELFRRYLANGGSTHRQEAREFLRFLAPEPSIIVNSIGMRLVRVPAGTFRMGSRYAAETIRRTFSEHSPANAFADEHPIHEVTLSKDFFIGQYEVTSEQYAKFVAATGYVTDAEKQGGAFRDFDPNVAREGDLGWSQALTWRSSPRNHPVTFVSWNDANQFLIWLNKQEPNRYRLPTEAEWEYCARAGTETIYSTGNSVSTLRGYANLPDESFRRDSPQMNYDHTPWNDGYATTAPVGSFLPNEFNLYDVHGNAFEWCYDGYDADAYRKHRRNNPYIKPDTSFRVLRGGCFM